MGLLSSQLSSKEMALLCRELATVYSAGIPLLKALQLAAKHRGPAKARRALENMAASIQDGATLGDAARAQRTILPDMFIEVVAAGEVSGRLDVLLRDLAAYYEDTWKMWSAAAASMAYPLLQLLSAWFLGTFSLGIVGKLNPASSERFVMREYMSAYMMFQVKAIVIVVVCAAILIALGRTGVLRAPWATLKMAIWPVRHISNKFALARFFRTMALLISSGVSIRHCIERSAACTLNPIIERDLLRAVPVVMKGGSLVEAFAGSRYISRLGREMLAVGEQSGNLDAALQKVAEYHTSEAQTALQIATKLVFVASILIVGVIVGSIVIRFYGSYYGSLMNNF